MRTLVAGGAGFLGAHLCRSLLDAGHEVLCVDNFYSGSRTVIADLLEHPRFEFLRHDITLPLHVEVDEIVNLACPASPKQYARSPIQVTKASVVGSLHLLGLARRLRVPIVLTSTSEVYGDPEVHPQHESYVGHCNPVGPRACYHESKRCAETLFTDYRRHHGVQARIVRLFNVYGPGMAPDDGRVVSSFVVAALRGEPLTVHGRGEQTRSFCYVDDMIEALLLAMGNDFSRPVNLGNPVETTIAELARLVLDVTCSASEIHFVDALPEDPHRRCPDTTRAREVLGWQPSTCLREGVEITKKWFAERLK